MHSVGIYTLLIRCGLLILLCKARDYRKILTVLVNQSEEGQEERILYGMLYAAAGTPAYLLIILQNFERNLNAEKSSGKSKMAGEIERGKHLYIFSARKRNDVTVLFRNFQIV